ncbi:DUF4292 domain-containing protein [Paludibacter sp. 221]|uniref:DUF4292 domain-containing protein n=1 Tax=Paludibacter sp. 221 TaxID=2302939 RepID=UPI0013D6229D|nr:DUF4292 domain-containing protein [Paludibacter sp. 221]NDV46482.1 DUF4292 domain-containing protein [Paludibacter sp. 221]
MKKFFLFSVILGVMLFSACKSSRTLQRGQKASSFSHLIQLVEQAQPSFKSMSATKIAVGVSMDGNQMSVSANLKIITDSVVQLSIIPFMGIEAYSLELYPDKWILYDKINRKYYTDGYDYFYYTMGIDADFYSLQSLFSARLFSIGKREVNIKDLKYTPLEDGKNQISFESAQVNQETFLTNTHVIENVLLKDKKQDNTLVTNYNEYVETKGINYPRNIVISLLNKEVSVFSLDMKLQKVVFDSELKLSLSNMERYTRGTLDQLMK